MVFSEKLLQYVWLHRLFDPGGLTTTSGDAVQVVSPGTWNADAGPDFLHARVRVGDTLLAGNVELHLAASDWIKHKHSDDKSYHNLILHVVYDNDIADRAYLPAHIPVLELKGRIPGLLLDRYYNLMQHDGNILCAGQVSQVKPLTWINWKDRLLVERWQRKTAFLAALMEGNKNNWEETFYIALARNFGLPVNGDAFAALAQSIPLKVLAKHKDNCLQLEALLFGQAGMLNEKFSEQYPLELQTAYQFLKNKYSLMPMPPHVWKWMRMRPSAFPSVRLAQFAALIHQSSHLFSKILEAEDINIVFKLLDVTASPYWDNHYRFSKRDDKEKQSKPQKKRLGKSMIQNILINTVCPMLAMYDRFQLNQQYLDRAFAWMKMLPPENNRYTREWDNAGIKNLSAWDSQALLHLTHDYCMEKRCLECAVGNKILRPV